LYVTVSCQNDVPTSKPRRNARLDRIAVARSLVT